MVSTVLILNYHHRNADTHEMAPWVTIGLIYKSIHFRKLAYIFGNFSYHCGTNTNLGPNGVLTLAAMRLADE